MICPACNKVMVEEDFGGVHVDVCRNGCMSMWFDWGELGKLDEHSEGFGELLEDALAAPRVHDEGRGKLNCPKCGIPMYLHKYSRAQEVNVDECVSCGGFFLDSGELSLIRDYFMDEAEHQAYTKKLVAEVADYGDRMVSLEKQKARTAAVSGFARMFMSPSRRRWEARMEKRKERRVKKPMRKDQTLRIAELKEQLRIGMITEEEFADKTAEILSEFD